jgi:hypothetical protein
VTVKKFAKKREKKLNLREKTKTNHERSGKKKLFNNFIKNNIMLIL